MKLVIYLSGRINKSAQWHREQDSVAASLGLSKTLEKIVLDSVEQRMSWPEELTDDEGNLKSWTDPLPWIDSDELSDLASDLGGTIGAQIAQLLQCEASCGYVHVVKTGSA